MDIQVYDTTLCQAGGRQTPPIHHWRHAIVPRRHAAITALLVVSAARAQEPTFSFTKPEPVAHPVWKATAQLGLMATSGNSDAFGASASASASRRSGQTRVSGEARGAFARSQVQIAVESDGVPGIGSGELGTITATTTESWEVRARLDRYLGARNSLYLSAGAAGDRPSGKRFIGGGQVGYARAIVLTPSNELSVELGYDLAHQDYVGSTGATTSHSARAFLGYQLKPFEAVALRVSVDGLANLAAERAPTRVVPALGHARLLGRAEADVKVNSKGSLGLRFRGRYDSAPAQRPPFPGLEYEPGFTPLAERLDTTTELVFIYTLR